jgi:hypothetical protein
MAVAFVILYPVGALLIPLFGKWYLHAGCQTIAFLVMWGGFGTGYAQADATDEVSFFPPSPSFSRRQLHILQTIKHV